MKVGNYICVGQIVKFYLNVSCPLIDDVSLHGQRNSYFSSLHFTTLESSSNTCSPCRYPSDIKAKNKRAFENELCVVDLSSLLAVPEVSI